VNLVQCPRQQTAAVANLLGFMMFYYSGLTASCLVVVLSL
jgi:hypothetical protein